MIVLVQKFCPCIVVTLFFLIFFEILSPSPTFCIYASIQDFYNMPPSQWIYDIC